MNIFTKRSDVKVLDNCIICKLTLNMTLHLGWHFDLGHPLYTTYTQCIYYIYTSMYVVYEAIRIIIIIIYLGP